MAGEGTGRFTMPEGVELRGETLGVRAGNDTGGNRITRNDVGAITHVAVIEYFYAAHSAYAYTGSKLLSDHCRAGRRADRPIGLSTGTASSLRTDPAGSTPDVGRRAYFSGREIERWAEYRGVEIIACRMPTHHDNDIGLPNRMLIAGVLEGADVDALAHRILEAHWRYDQTSPTRKRCRGPAERRVSMRRDYCWQPRVRLKCRLSTTLTRRRRSSARSSARLAISSTATCSTVRIIWSWWRCQQASHLAATGRAIGKDEMGTYKRINVSSGRPTKPVVANYSRALRYGDMVLQSGTTAIDTNGDIIGENDIATHGRRHCRYRARHDEAGPRRERCGARIPTRSMFVWRMTR